MQGRPIILKAKLFHGFSDPARLSILETLRSGSLTVTEIVNHVGLSQPNVSNHLGCLRECGLVNSTQEGRYTRYQISDEHIGTLLSLAEELLANIGNNIYQCTRYNLPREIAEKKNE